MDVFAEVTTPTQRVSLEKEKPIPAPPLKVMKMAGRTFVAEVDETQEIPFDIQDVSTPTQRVSREGETETVSTVESVVSKGD